MLLAGAFGQQVQAQCSTCTYSVGNPQKRTNFNLIGGETLTIEYNVSYEGTITVSGSNVTILIDRSGGVAGNFAGTLTVNSGVTGTVVTNLGTVSSSSMQLNSPTTINNGSSTVSGAIWSGYVGANFTAAQTINNYGTWSSQISGMPGGTLNNYSGATWGTADLTTAGPTSSLAVLNNGTWDSQLFTPSGSTVTITNTGNWLKYFAPGGSATINNSGTWSATSLNYAASLTINHTGGSWAASLNSGTALTINNSATWTKGFNFPGTGPNSFTNAPGATASFDAYLGMGSATTITNRGTMNVSNGMADIGATSSLINSRDAVFRVTGQFVNSGTVSNAGIVSSTGNFVNNSGGVMSGPASPLRGSFTTNGYSVNAGTFGVTGKLNFCDAGNSTGFDSQTGTVGSGTTYCSLRPLPVELAAFSAELAKNQVQLRWTTASEQNSARFVVERSAQGEVFEAVREVAAQGNAANATTYAATDARPLAGTSYYRLRQVDLDGSVSYSPLAQVSSSAGSVSLRFYPNPVADQLTLDLTPAPAEPCLVRVLSLTGQVARTEVLLGGRLQEVPLAGLPAGLYLLQVRMPHSTTVQRIEKL